MQEGSTVYTPLYDKQQTKNAYGSGTHNVEKCGKMLKKDPSTIHNVPLHLLFQVDYEHP
jgi:hypothetical protein